MGITRVFVLAIAVGCGVLVAPAVARAHDLNAVVTVTEQSVRVVAGFEDDTAEFASVTVTDAAGNEIASGKTDETGLWTFPRPAPGEYTLTVKSMGHVATVKFNVEGDSNATFTGWRLNKMLGLAIGVVGLLGLSLAYWWFRLRRD